jgi:hypothetical protein
MAVPIVSVVMSVFNGERFLEDAVESILTQSLRDFEFIVVNDGSTDHSAAILDRYQNSDARLKVCQGEHAGLIESLNRGCALAQGKYIARMDADDVAIKDRLIWQTGFMDSHPEIGVVGGAVEWIDATGKPLVIRRYPSDDEKIKTTLLQEGSAFWHPTVVLRREVFVRAGGYRRVVVDAEDYDLWLRIADHYQLANLEKVVLKYRIHPHQVSMRKTAQQTLGMIAAQVAASTRRNGLADPLNSMAAITGETLASLGVTEPMLSRRFVSYRRDWIRNMVTAGEYCTALAATVEILHSNLKYVDRGVIADLHLIAAKLWWRQKRFTRGLLALIQAVITFPSITWRLQQAMRRRIGQP